MATADLSSICWLAVRHEFRSGPPSSWSWLNHIVLLTYYSWKCYILFLHIEKPITQFVLICFLWDVQSLSNTFYCVTLHTLQSLCSFSVILRYGPSVYCPASQHPHIKHLLKFNMMWLWVFQKVSQHRWPPSFLIHRLFIRRFVSRYQRWTRLRVLAFTTMVAGC